MDALHRKAVFDTSSNTLGHWDPTRLAVVLFYQQVPDCSVLSTSSSGVYVPRERTGNCALLAAYRNYGKTSLALLLLRLMLGHAMDEVEREATLLEGRLSWTELVIAARVCRLVRYEQIQDYGSLAVRL
jgi:hypothetical protein